MNQALKARTRFEYEEMKRALELPPIMYASAPLHIPAQEREGDEDEGQDQLDIDNGEMSSLQAPIEPPPSPSPALVRKSSRGRGAPKKTLKQRMLRLKDPYLKIFMVQNEDGSTHEEARCTGCLNVPGWTLDMKDVTRKMRQHILTHRHEHLLRPFENKEERSDSSNPPRYKMPPPPTFPPRTPSLEQPLVGDGEESLPLKELQARLLQCNDPLLQLVTTDNGDPAIQCLTCGSPLWTENTIELGKKLRRHINSVRHAEEVNKFREMDELGHGRRKRVLLGVTGSVAAIKVHQICQALLPVVDVIVVYTRSSLNFFDPTKLPHGVTAYADHDEYANWTKRGDAVLHIQLRDFCDCLLIAPLSANTLASISHGNANNLLTCVARAWNFSSPNKRFILAPAMNTQMWNHPFTETQLSILRAPPLNAIVIPPVEKELMCGEVGVGAIASVQTIFDVVCEQLDVSPPPSSPPVSGDHQLNEMQGRDGDDMHGGRMEVGMNVLIQSADEGDPSAPTLPLLDHPM